MKYCERCGNQLEDHAKFCQVCGLPVFSAPPPRALNVCGKCGAKLSFGDAFCQKCGSPVSPRGTGAPPFHFPTGGSLSTPTPAPTQGKTYDKELYIAVAVLAGLNLLILCLMPLYSLLGQNYTLIDIAREAMDSDIDGLGSLIASAIILIFAPGVFVLLGALLGKKWLCVSSAAMGIGSAITILVPLNAVIRIINANSFMGLLSSNSGSSTPSVAIAWVVLFAAFCCSLALKKNRGDN